MIEFGAGVIAGLAITTTGHPFDTIKVRMQVGHNNSALRCIWNTAKYEGIRGFYKGFTFPLYSVPVINSVVFGTYAQANRFIGDAPPFTKGILAGSYAGLVNCLVVCPVEFVKCRMQAQMQGGNYSGQLRYHSSFECAVDIARTQGVTKLFTGMVATIYREVPSYATQFAAYELSSAGLRWYLGRESLPLWGIYICGVFGGLNSWIWSFPQDVVKTRLQVHEHLHVGAWDGGFLKTAKEVWETEGWIGFWKGFTPCAMRATVAYGFGFIAYEKSQPILRSAFNLDK